MTRPITRTKKKIVGPAECIMRCSSRILARRILKDEHTRSVSPLRVREPGCGRGLLLKALQSRGCECTGLERPDFPADNIGEGITFSKGDVYAMPFPDASFDMVILWHVLEHLSNPFAALRESRRVLTEGGLLLIAVPNIDSRQARYFGKKWFHLDVPRHTHHFSIETLSFALESAGLKIVEPRGVAPEQSIFGFVQSALNMCVPVRHMNQLFFRLKQIRHICDFIELGFWLLLTTFLIPAACIEYVVSLRSNRSALLQIGGRK